MSLYKQAAWTPRDWHAFNSLLLGGGAVGLGAGVTVSLARQLRALQRQAAMEQELKNTMLPVRLLRPEAPDAQVDPLQKDAGALAGGLGLAGGVVSGWLSYRLAQMLYDKFAQSEVTQKLKDSQEGYERALLQTLPAQSAPGQYKKAADGRAPGLERFLGWLALAGVPLTGYLTHMTSRRVLDKAFPATDFRKLVVEQGRPVQLEEVTVPRAASQEDDQEGLEADDAELTKTAGYMPEEHVATLFTAPLLHQSVDRSMSASWQWVKAAAHNPDALSRIDSTNSLRDMTALGEGSPADLSFAEQMLANVALLKHASVGQQYAMLVASEWAEAMPLTYDDCLKASAALTDRSVKMAAVLGRAVLDSALQEFCTSDIPDGLDAVSLEKQAAIADPIEHKLIRVALRQARKAKLQKLLMQDRVTPDQPEAESTQESKQGTTETPAPTDAPEKS